MQDRILEELNRHDVPVELDELADALNADYDTLEECVDELCEQGLAMYTRRGKVALPRWLGCVCGRLQGNKKGFAFLLPLDKDEQDVFIPSYAMNGAIHDDLVAARVTATAKRGRITKREGEVVDILKRARQTIVCKFEKSAAAGLAMPEDSRISQPILIKKGAEKQAQTGDLVVVDITRWPDDMRIAEGEVLEVLGKSGSAADVLAIVRHYGLFDSFTEESQRQAEAIPQQVQPHELKGREDFRDWHCVTIDGEDARDFDDAISLRKDGYIYELGVHIADVSHYVRPGSSIDDEAYERGTSTYFPDMVLPMLPFELSNGICSLRQGEDRLCISCVIRIQPDGGVESYRFCKSVINVRRRLTYTVANAMLNHDDAVINEYSQQYHLLCDMHELALILTARRRSRGSLDFDLPESHIVLDDEGRPLDIYPYERGASNVMIEEFMLTANECTARFAQDNDIPFIYRIHENPDEQRIDELYALVETLGVDFRRPKGTRIRPKALQQLLNQVDGQPYASVVNRVMLRCQKKAKYSPENSGHFGLALRNYCHFTSPIRRYPDLVVHRMLSAYMAEGLQQKALEKWQGEMKETSIQCSERERVSMEAERAVDDLKKAEYMRDRVGRQYTGIISGVTDFGIFVELPSTVEGMIRIAALEDDYYIYDEKQYRIIGERSGISYSMGDRMEIIVAGVDLASRSIDFAPVPRVKESNGSKPHKRRRPRRTGTKPDIPGNPNARPKKKAKRG